MLNNKYVRFFIFLLCNFLALAIGSYLMNNGPRSEWYINLHKAPWTPPGVVFGIAWSLIMLCFSFYMTKLSFALPLFNRKITLLYVLQWVLNVGWNYFFFGHHRVVLGLAILFFLFSLLVYLFFHYKKHMVNYSFFLLPYLLWMLVAISLNGFILLNN